MIRDAVPSDYPAMVDVWLAASLKAHDFIAPSFWYDQLDTMRDTYLPAARNWVWYEHNHICGFISLRGENIEALFVEPSCQGRGVGNTLLAFLQSIQPQLTLSVYRDNAVAVAFYRRHGFEVVGGRPDPHTGCAEYMMKWTRSR